MNALVFRSFSKQTHFPLPGPQTKAPQTQLSHGTHRLISPPPKAAHNHRMLRSSPGEWLQRATARCRHLFQHLFKIEQTHTLQRCNLFAHLPNRNSRAGTRPRVGCRCNGVYHPTDVRLLGGVVVHVPQSTRYAVSFVARACCRAIIYFDVFVAVVLEAAYFSTSSRKTCYRLKVRPL